MKLGAYVFEWVPDEMDIPRPEKTTAVQPNLGNVGFFSWGPQLIGKEVKMKWRFTSVDQYEVFKALYLAGGVHVLDLNPEEIYIPPPGGGGDDPVDFSSYPDPSHPGVYPGPPYKRYYIGPPHMGDLVLNNYMYWNYSPVMDATNPDYNGYAKVINLDIAGSFFIEFGPDSPDPFPDFRVGDIIYDDGGFVWATIVPWDTSLRNYYIYPNPHSVDDKIYYRDVMQDSPRVPSTLSVGDRIYNDWEGYEIITELGSDDIGTWFKGRAAVEDNPAAVQCVWTAGDRGETGSGTYRIFNIAPWGPVSGGPFG